LSYDKERAY